MILTIQTPNQMKRLKVIAVLIKGQKCLVDRDETMVLYNGDWYEMQPDIEGDFYIIVDGQTLYIDAYFNKEIK